MPLDAITPGMAVVFAIVLATLVLFATESLPVDVTAIGVMVTLMLVEPVTGVAADLGLVAGPVSVLPPVGESGVGVFPELTGFASTATITVFAMFVLSAGVQRTGAVHRLGAKVAALTGDSEGRQLGATIGLVGPISGFINNTAAVAILLPMVTDVAHEGRVSPSKLLLPLSYASMFGGMLTLIGTSTNILASELAARLGPQYDGLEAFTMFEFTGLGLVLLVVGSAYLLTVGRWLTPERIPPESDLTDEFGMAEYLTEVVVREDSPLVGRTVHQVLAETDLDVDVIQLVRDDVTFLEPLGPKVVRAGDLFLVRTDRDTLVDLLDAEGLDVVVDVDDPDAATTDVTAGTHGDAPHAAHGDAVGTDPADAVTLHDEALEVAEDARNLVEVVIAPGSGLVGDTLESANFRDRYDATVLALRRGGDVVRQRVEDLRLRVGDTLLVQGTRESLDRLNDDPDFIVAQEIARPNFREEKVPVAVAVVAGVVGVAALTPIHIVVSALAGALAMVLTGCLRPPEIYESVQWDVIFLLAGVIPLGLALEHTGGAGLLADALVAVAPALSPILVLGLVYLVTALLTNVISNNASVVLMVPVAAEAAVGVGSNPFAFVIAVTFAASTAFMTPVGYQTNLFVYGPGGYRFTDYLRVGAPLQAIFTVVTTLGIAFFWGLAPP